MAKRKQKGALHHPEGGHGGKTHWHQVRQLESGPRSDPLAKRLADERDDAAYENSRRLVADRQQHDEAERNSELTESITPVSRKLRGSTGRRR